MNEPRRHVSWAATDAASPPDESVLGLVRRRWTDREMSLFDMLVAFLLVAIADLTCFLATAEYVSLRCNRDCGLRSQLHLNRIGLVITLVWCALPVVVAFVIQRQRVLIALMQVVLCGFLVAHNVGWQITLEQRLNGTVPCWNDLYSPADCPWGARN